MYKCYLCDYEGDMKIKSKVNGRDIVCCPNCKLEFIYNQPNFEEIKSIYSNDYYKAWGMEDGENNEVALMKKSTFRNMLKKILPYKKSGNILDIGTASGFLLEEAKEMGFEPYGVEISEYSSSIAKKKFGEDRIYNGTLETAPFENNFFDVITMTDLLEHVQDPVSILKISNKLLRNYTGGGYILITIPDTVSFSHNVMKKKWTQYKLEHLFYFNRKNMEIIAKKTGFEIIYMKPAVKTMTIKYMRNQFNVYKLFPITQIFNIVNSIPVINNFRFNVMLGESLVILKKV
ncbi:class I SAM-dependent methyltransferase [Brachyspira hyodysenteriae]|uniref:Methyltransferase n=4 Tax=Brachyspira hyodysenteriae TaxID=159 RepID=A0A3B6W1J7_BRAHO|nr:class I SAM-dependent methyltransferase [Brachyspira hyodysenteriae]ANN63740.1 methyltransferase [Brachyspira hyodysenteriae ATCC 27164]MCZ9838214.1 class I SAM-dependent methyltransferase [Brachyspira hyodysenteriae]MCZ9849324.1 class I SAM-dependent methyltransferase [Brachyspira hyodysenteriae]MCZ9860864.1 class I SAM-dependent methyltransferase [Brachyspira hyodysenteriae]MCZ9873788.1 class I SAM-dependent methyltransferase [Brachyspira hyodysenteriae]